MWKHVFINCILPCVKKSNDHHNKNDKHGNLFRNFFSTDGEDIIISNAYENDLVELMEQIRIDYGRVGAGSTAIHNACDRWVQFRLSKHYLKKWRLKGKVITNETLRLNLEHAFNEFKSKYSNINYRLKESIIQGIITLVHVYEETMKPDQIRKAFLCCGQHCQPDAVGATVSFDKMMEQCYSDINNEKRLIMKLATPRLLDILRFDGRVSWENMNNENIPVGSTSINRDRLTHIRHMSEIINHEGTIARFEEEIASRSDVRRLEVQADKELQAALDKIEKEREKEFAKATKIAAKNRAKTDFAALPLAEQVRIKKQRADDNAEKRSIKKAKEDDEIARAESIIRLHNQENIPLNVMMP